MSCFTFSLCLNLSFWILNQYLKQRNYMVMNFELRKIQYLVMQHVKKIVRGNRMWRIFYRDCSWQGNNSPSWTKYSILIFTDWRTVRVGVLLFLLHSLLVFVQHYGYSYYDTYTQNKRKKNVLNVFWSEVMALRDHLP